LAADLRKSNAAGIFPGVGGLTTHLREILADPGYTPLLGASDAYLQASRIQVPLSAELGVTSWLTLGITVPLMKSRVEGEMGLLPTVEDDLGLNPAFTAYTQVLAFTEELAAAAAALPAGDAEVWGPWATRWTRAYAASAVFPAAGTAAGDALLASLDAFNTVLAGAGVAPVTAPIPLADGVLTNESLAALLVDPSAHFQFLPLPTQLLWALGDVEVQARIKVLEGPRRPSTGRPEFGVVALGGLRLPTGAGEETRAIYDLPMGEGILGYSAGAAAWVRRGRLGIASVLRYGISGSTEVERRVGPGEVPLIPVSNLSVVEYSPGNTLDLELRPSFSAAPALTLEGFYRHFRKDPDNFEATQPLPAPPDVLVPYPSGLLYLDPTVLESGTGSTLHLVGGGLRYHPPEGEFPVEVWANVQVAVAGSGGLTLKEKRLSFGGRATWRLWGGDR